MASNTELADIILNRQSVALARSRRLVQSWLPPKVTPEEGTPNQEPDDDDDFEGMTELQGVGSKRKAEDEGVLDGLKRKKLSSDDKLLEQLLGKKAAQARKKTLEATRSRLAPKPQVKGPVIKQRVESDDEEEGRAASFKSRKAKAEVVSAAPEIGVDSHDGGEDGTSHQDTPQSQPARAKEDAPIPVKKRKAGSYLDELLSQKAAKKKRKRKKLDAAEA